ncbi:MAG: hypothetical protein HeimC3_39910 [Candidatus Heimdallarchaeota archaeon LC_3]|nr:MAG: hypothetical protein HeimC3_39910 [Candidatus Heimdallarchaeota archaeon LC_3]
MMSGLHSPSLHFHIGAWAVTALCTFLAFWINFLQKRNLLPKVLENILGPFAVQRLDYVAHVTGIIGFLGIVASAYFGFIDASGVAGAGPLDISAALKGIDVSFGNEVLAFKVTWTIVALQAFIFAGLIRFYFVTLNHANSVYDRHTAVQVIYAESTLLGFFLLVMVAGAGGIWVYGKSILTDVPILQDFLPQGNLMIPLVTLSALLALTLLVSSILRESITKQKPEKRKETV